MNFNKRRLENGTNKCLRCVAGSIARCAGAGAKCILQRKGLFKTACNYDVKVYTLYSFLYNFSKGFQPICATRIINFDTSLTTATNSHKYFTFSLQSLPVPDFCYHSWYLFSRKKNLWTLRGLL